MQGLYNLRRKGPFVAKIRGNTKLLLAFVCGVLIGRLGSWEKNSLETPAMQSSIQHLEDLPVRNTSHVNPNTGVAITKKQFLEPFVVPRVTGFSVATIQTGESVELHSHQNMHEFFLVLSGEATFWMCSSEKKEPKGYLANAGTFWHVVPHCAHGITVAPNSTQGDLKVLVSGVTVGA